MSDDSEDMSDSNKEHDPTRCMFCGRKLGGRALHLYLSDRGFSEPDEDEDEGEDDVSERLMWKKACDDHGVVEPAVAPDSDSLEWLEIAAQHEIVVPDGVCVEVATRYSAVYDEQWPDVWDTALVFVVGPSPKLIEALKSLDVDDLRHLAWLVDPIGAKTVESLDDLLHVNLLECDLEEEQVEAVKRGLEKRQ